MIPPQGTGPPQATRKGEEGRGGADKCLKARVGASYTHSPSSATASPSACGKDALLVTSLGKCRRSGPRGGAGAGDSEAGTAPPPSPRGREYLSPRGEWEAARHDSLAAVARSGWCGVVWCGVLWCGGLRHSLMTNRKQRQCTITLSKILFKEKSSKGIYFVTKKQERNGC
ncbi:hypothetical protein E2C01_017172 [Portunus trituberculatus]|uniref:Uncharacterized protein n=1 Tax=Portunus trituberculatus TaxID=210409 RepID=A0A5B7DR71_PORTR|nr:hypothetical protein [Portunus trituberculatus]